MSTADWAARRYGFGAARIPLSPASRRVRIETRPLREGLRAARREGDTADLALGRRAARALPLLITTSLLLSWLTTVLLAAPPDESGVQIVPFEAPPLEIAALPPESIPEPAPLRPAPEPQPEIAPPPPQARPEPVQPEPVQLARIEPIPPAPEPRPRRAPQPPPARRAPEPPPRPSLQAVAPPPPSQAPIREPVRQPVEFASVRPSAPRHELRAAPAPPRSPTPRPPDSARSTRSRPRTPLERPAPALPVPALAPAGPSRRAPQRSARRSPAAEPPRRRGRASNLALDLPAARGADRSAPPPPAAPAPRSERRGAAAPARQRGRDAPDLPGVALGSLDACVSHRDEDALKRRLVGVVGDRVQCESPNGRYHFVQTRNLNAFLMRIERAPHRKPADRCAELTFALDCLSPIGKGGGR